jgi:hypothetical protein
MYVINNYDKIVKGASHEEKRSNPIIRIHCIASLLTRTENLATEFDSFKTEAYQLGQTAEAVANVTSELQELISTLRVANNSNDDLETTSPHDLLSQADADIIPYL